MERYSWKECERELKKEEFKKKAKETADKICTSAKEIWNNK